MSYVDLVLSNPRAQSDQLTVRITPFDHAISKKWLAALERCLLDGLHLEKNFCFVGFPETQRDLPYLCGELNHYVEVVNRFAAKGGWGGKYHIEERFSPEAVLEGGLNHPLMNRIHHHFEVLIGQVWNISEYFKNADDETRFAIRQLNNLCHEIEILVKAQQHRREKPELV